MDMRTGEIATRGEFERRGTLKRFLRPVAPAGTIENCIPLEGLTPRVRAMVQATGKGRVTRNSRCPCGSGKRFKRCCMVNDQAQVSSEAR